MPPDLSFFLAHSLGRLHLRSALRRLSRGPNQVFRAEGDDEGNGGFATVAGELGPRHGRRADAITHEARVATAADAGGAAAGAAGNACKIVQVQRKKQYFLILMRSGAMFFLTF